MREIFVVACDLVYFAVPGFLIIRKPEAAEPTDLSTDGEHTDRLEHV